MAVAKGVLGTWISLIEMGVGALIFFWPLRRILVSRGRAVKPWSLMGSDIAVDVDRSVVGKER